jgi:predicted transcriptional regulator of viral defense system
VPGKIFMNVLDIAREQHGFVRTADLREIGISPKRLNEYAKRGHADHLGYGIYRMHLIPPGEWDEFVQATIWPDGRGVLSHETALDLYELCDVSPNHIDLTVPKAYRTHREVPRTYRLHQRDLPVEEVTYLEGAPIVTPARAIADGLDIGLRPSLVEQAIDTAQRQALITSNAATDLRARRNREAHRHG